MKSLPRHRLYHTSYKTYCNAMTKKKKNYIVLGLLVVRHAHVVQLLDDHCEQCVHVPFFREIPVALLGLDNEYDVGRLGHLSAVETQKFAFGDFRIVARATPV